MTFGRWLITHAIHEEHWVFGIVIGKITFSENEKALGFVLNLGAGGMIVGYKL